MSETLNPISVEVNAPIAVKFNAPLERLNVSRVNRWFILKECVTDDRRINVTSIMSAASGVCIVKGCP